MLPVLPCVYHFLISPSLSCSPRFSLVSFEVLNNERATLLSSLGNPGWNCMAQCSTAESCPQDHSRMGGKEAASEVWSACSDNNNGCTEALILQAVNRLHLHSMADERYDSFLVPVCVCCCDCWTWITVHFLTGCVWDFQGVIMETHLHVKTLVKAFH